MDVYYGDNTHERLEYGWLKTCIQCYSRYESRRFDSNFCSSTCRKGWHRAQDKKISDSKRVLELSAKLLQGDLKRESMRYMVWAFIEIGRALAKRGLINFSGTISANLTNDSMIFDSKFECLSCGQQYMGLSSPEKCAYCDREVSWVKHYKFQGLGQD